MFNLEISLIYVISINIFFIKTYLQKRPVKNRGFTSNSNNDILLSAVYFATSIPYFEGDECLKYKIYFAKYLGTVLALKGNYITLNQTRKNKFKYCCGTLKLKLTTK